MATRRESVRLELVDNFTPGMARAAAATAMLNRELNNLSGQEIAASRSSQAFVRDVQNVSVVSTKADASINQLTGRLRVLGEVAAVLGPALAPLGGVAIAGVAGLASQMGAAAIAGGVLIGSLQGVGDALGAMNKAQLDPTNKNLEAAEDALKRLSPAAREFAEAAFDLKPALIAIRDMGAESLAPGLTESLDSLERLGPKVANIFEALGGAMGDVAANSSASLASDRWADFFSFVEQEIPDAITELATTVGSLTHGMVELWEAFTPLNDDFSSWLMNVSAGFDDWATGLSATEGFQEFIDYVRTTGPQVADTLGALGEALVQIVQATAPLGGPVLAGIEAFATAVSAIADSDLGTPIMAGVAALSLLNRTLAVTASLSNVSLSSGLFSGLGTLTQAARGGSSGSPLTQLQAMPAALRAATSAQEGLLASQKRASTVTASYVGQLQAVNSVTARGFKPSMQTLDRLGDSLDQVEAANRNVAVAATQAADAEKKRSATMRASLGEIGKGAAVIGGLTLATSGAADGMGLTNTASMALMGTLAGPWGAAVGAGAGLLLDLKAANDGAAASFDAFEASLKSMSLDELNTKLRETNDLFSEANKVGETGGPKGETAAVKAIREQVEVTKLAEVRAKGAALAFLQQTGANVDLAKWSGKTKEQIKAQADAIIESQEAAQKTAQSFVTLGESLDDSKTSLGDWIKELADNAAALEAFTANSRRAAKRGLNEGLIASLQEAGEVGARRMRQLANASDTEIEKANAAWRRGKQAMKEYNDYKIPPKKVTADTSRAMQSFREVDTYLSSLDGKTATTYVNTVRTITGPKGAAVFGQKADGGTIEGPRQPYGDKMLYLLAPGEEVISNRNGQADKHRPLLKAINGGLAEGGTAGGKKKRKRTFNGEVVADEFDTAGSEQAAMQAAEAQEQFYSEQERREREAERRAEHESDLFLAAIEGQERAAQGLIDAANEQKKSAEEVRDGWAQAMQRAGSAATSGFQSSLFGAQQRGTWAGGSGAGGSWRNALGGDIAGLQERGGLIAQLQAQGITGSALEALMGGSNADISSILGSGEAGAFAAMFAQREALQTQVSTQAGQAAYGAQFAAADAAVTAVAARIAFLEAQLASISAQRPITVLEAASAYATAMEIARQQAMQGAA